MSDTQFAQLFEQDRQQRQLAEGTDLLVQVRDINDNYVIVNAGLKSEAHIPLAEFHNSNNELEVAIGDKVEVEIELLENGRGETVLSRRNTRRKQIWRKIEESMNGDSALTAVVTNRVRGGYSVAIDDLRAFLPGSLVDIFPKSEGTDIVGQTIEVRPIKINKPRNSLVVSRRAVIERAMLEPKDSDLMNTIAVDSRLRGTVKAIVEYGAFVEIAAGLYGLLHITDVSWKHTISVANVLQIGEEIDVIVLSIDKEKGRISLGAKQLQPNPWEFFDRTHPVGSRIFGKIARVLEYGVLVEIEDGIQGLVHSSEISWTRRNPSPNKLYNVGEEIEVTVLEIDSKRHRVSLSIKQCAPNPWQEFAVAYRKGDRITAKVRSISEFGIFMELPGNIDGLVRMGELSYEDSGQEVAAQYQKGQEVEVMILSIDDKRERIRLGIKQTKNEGFQEFSEQYMHGSKVRGTVTAIAEKGAQVKLEGEIRGFLPISEISEQRVKVISDHIEEGKEYEFILLDNNMDNMQAIVSLKESNRQQRDKIMQERRQQAPVKNTLGAMLQAKIQESVQKIQDIAQEKPTPTDKD